MTAVQFKEIWSKSDDNLSRISRDRLIGLGLNSSTIEFLTASGLPKDAEPFLSFCEDNGPN